MVYKFYQKRTARWHVATAILLLYRTMCAASVPDTVIINGTPLLYHYIHENNSTAKGLMIYMHGGVSQFKALNAPIAPEPVELLEGNTNFLPAMQAAGYDVIMPVAYKGYNWLEPGGEQFINEIITQHADKYGQLIIAGFSDGGTGAFRFFNNAPEKYYGVIVFNGYPQLQNYYKKVDHYKATGKHIIYCSTLADKVIPYEFLLVEFRRQQMVNEQTYFILKEGSHSFTAYNTEDFAQCTLLMNKAIQHKAHKDKIMVFAPVDGLVINGEIKQLYPFRKKTGKTYSMSATEYGRDDIDIKDLSKQLSSGTKLELLPTELTKEQLESSDNVDFVLKTGVKETRVQLINWLHTPTW